MNSEHFRILKLGVATFNDWRKLYPKVEPNLRGANLSQEDLCKVDLRRADLYGANLSGSNLRKAKFNKADLSEASLKGADLRKAHFFEANLQRTDFNQSIIEGAILCNADLSEQDLSGMDFSSINFSNADLKSSNLSNSNLQRARLRDAILAKADLRGANLKRTDLGGTNFTRADLGGANLSGAYLPNSDLTEADLRDANFSKTWLQNTVFNKSFVDGVNFRDATFASTYIIDIDFSNTTGLESANHFGPSTISIDTIFRSAGNISYPFLENAGVPDILLEHLGSMTAKPFQFFSCFISHCTEDKEFAERLFADLRKEGVRCWFAPEDMKGGKKLFPQIDEAIRIYDKLLLILSESSIKSDWVANEIRWARKREKHEGRQKLFPVRIISYERLKDWQLFDTDTVTELSAEVRSYYIPDFTNWKDHDSYKKVFSRLLRDLKENNQ